MFKKGDIMHTAIGLHYLEERIQDAMAKGQKQSYLMVNEVPMSNAAALGVVRGFIAQGQRYWPGCDNLDVEGHCAGHEDSRLQAR